tara:strand:+ start:1282 stop:1500 length:219 start_codon:yes stop_codon:yes gene_type:complete
LTTKIPGYIKVNLSLLTILAISSVSSTGLQIYRMVNSTSAENTFNKKENLKVEKEKSLANQIGRSIMEVQMN